MKLPKWWADRGARLGIAVLTIIAGCGTRSLVPSTLQPASPGSYKLPSSALSPERRLLGSLVGGGR